MTASFADRDALRRKTAPLLLCERAEAMGDAVAFRSKQLGLYRERCWRDYAQMVGRMALALERLGLKSGERIAIMGDPCEEWMLCDLAAQSLGAIVYGIYPTASASEVEYQMRDGGAAIFVAQDQEYVDKILPLADRLPNLRHIVVIDDSAMFGYAHAEDQAVSRSGGGRDGAGPRRVPCDGGARQAGAACLYRLYVRDHRPSQGRAGDARQAPRRNRQRGRALPDAARQGAPHRHLSAALPHPRPRCGCHHAADLAAHPAFRRRPGGPAGDAVRGRPDRSLHGAALSAEIRLAGAGWRAQLKPHQAHQPRPGMQSSLAATRPGAGTARRALPDTRSIGCAAQQCSHRSSTSSASTSWSC